MVSATQRITQYNREAGQPRGGLINPSMLTRAVTEDEHGVLDHKIENLHASVIGMAVDYLTRLARVRTVRDEFYDSVRQVFRVSLRGAERVDAVCPGFGVAAAAQEAVASIRSFETERGRVMAVIDEGTVGAACQLAGYDVGGRNDPRLWNPEHGAAGIVPNEMTITHVAIMLARTQAFFAEYGPVTKDGFVFADPVRDLLGEPGGYTDLVDSGDGDFLTTDTLWDMKVSANKPTKDQTLQLLMYFLMGKESGLPEFAGLTHVGLFNPRLATVHRLAVADVPAETIQTIRRDVIGYS
ncbi:hypothetical protein Q9R19_06345 [Microbacterium sp. ARD32]|uniref:hypothetical protein n=1 Tax=Microbacterium sp. ARD32 TaxID=2962577 RepID=UPI002882C84D|nr:hypothetical protein [Microbacterium sp. ARD32]MDT0157243.1 hypothetical protein [Microbacterium sp. ARD32]